MTGVSIDLQTKSPLYVGLLFGGQSGEHDVSITSARAIASALSQNPRYQVQPFYIQCDGTWRSPDVSKQVLDSGKALQESELLTNAACKKVLHT